MTEYFEVLDRDGPARRGELRLEPPVTTPVIGDDILSDAGSLWAADREIPGGADDQVTILPHRAFPTGTHEPVTETFSVPAPDVAYPAGAVVSPETATEQGVDLYALSGISGYDGHARRLVESIVEARTAIPDDTALYVSGLATPASAPLLCYAGVDVVDTAGCVAAGHGGTYLTPEGSQDLEQTRELPCSCETCADTTPDELSGDAIASHNVATLQAVMRRVRERIREGTLRDFVSAQVRHVPWLTAGLRVLDEHWGYLEERSPVAAQREQHWTTDDAIRRVEVQRFADRVTSRYRPSLSEYPLVLVPCSATKPYSESPSHDDFREAIGYRGHIVSLTSPLGVVPDELELTYPAQHYDVPVTGRWSATEREHVQTVLDRYLRTAEYDRVVAHVPDDGYREVVAGALASVDLPVTYTVEDHPRSEDDLGELALALDGIRPYTREERYRAIVDAIAAYQFDAPALFANARISGRYPRLRLHDGDDQLATLVPHYGLFALTLAGARRWRDRVERPRTVEIDAFVPHGSVLAPGIIEADETIRVGDEVIVSGPDAFAVGRATMPGPAMTESTRGIAVDVRHVTERDD